MATEQDYERLNYLKKRLLTMEWDKNLNQLNSGMEQKLGELKKEFDELSKKMQG